MMIESLISLKRSLKLLKLPTDSLLFKLHSLTALLLFIACLVVTARQYFGDPILCFHNKFQQINEVNIYCWIHYTYSIHDAQGDDNHIYSGVGPSNDESERYHHKYYQWVCFFLFVQACLFQLPRWIWAYLENGRVSRITSGPMDGKNLTLDFYKGQALHAIAFGSKYNYMYALKYIFCEILTLLNIILQFHLLVWLIGRRFRTYGPDMIEYFKEPMVNSYTNPMYILFPRMAKCSFTSYGPSGQVEIRDFLCLLPLNNMNDKIFLFIWFWFMIIGFVSFLLFFVRLCTICSSHLRTFIFRLTFPTVNARVLEVIRKTEFGDWFFLSLIGHLVGDYKLELLLEEIVDPGTSTKNH